MKYPEYCGTKKVRPSGQASVVYLDKEWGFNKGDIVDISIYNLYDPEDNRTTYSATKKLSKVGSGSAFYIDKIWGFVPGDEVVVKIRKKGKPSEDNA